MSLSVQALLDAPVIELDTIDSTNNYAMQLIDADTAQPGLTILARVQTRGKGQRGKTWEVDAGQSVLMSMILPPRRTPEEQFPFLTAITVAAADVLLELHEHWHVHIKWPNDIIVNDKKAGGILIENVWKGGKWSASVAGIGLNVLQETFPSDLPHATSLKLASGKDFPVQELAAALRERIVRYISGAYTDAELYQRYNQYLYRQSQHQHFTTGADTWQGTVVMVTRDGLLEVQQEDGSIRRYPHGSLTWKW